MNTWKLGLYVSSFIGILLFISIVSCLSVLSFDVKRLRDAYTLAYKNKERQHLQGSGLDPKPIPESSPQYSNHYAHFCADLILRLVKAHRHGLVTPSNLQSIGTCSTEHGKNSLWCLQSPGKVWLVFRGTCTKKEWLNNFEMQYAPKMMMLLKRKTSEMVFPILNESGDEEGSQEYIFPEGVKIHHGFLKIYSDLRSRIFRFLQTLPRGTEVNITGHSLGGALALITTLDIVLHLKRFKINTYVFGSPRVGNGVFANLLNNAVSDSINSLYLLVNNADIVPSIPLAVQPNVHKPNQPYEYNHPDNIITFIKNLGSWEANHRMETYIENLPK